MNEQPIYITLNKERETANNTLYSVDPGGVVGGNRIYLNTLWLRSQFGGYLPVRIRMSMVELISPAKRHIGQQRA